jgi:LacI family transcriptional regulator, galactose operon repressor
MNRSGRSVTRSDVARRAGVSTAVVSYVVNNGPRPVAAATRMRVLAAMSELGYRPNATARALRLRRASAVGLVVPDISNIYFGSLAGVLSSRAFDAGLALLLGDSENSLARESAQIESLVGRQVDGLIIISLDPGSSADTGGIPTVYLDMRTQADQSVIAIDNYGGARLAVEHLEAHGRTRIAHIGGPIGGPGADERHRGWRDAVLACGLELDESLVRRREFSRLGGFEAGGELLRLPDPPDAVFVSSDVQALGLLSAAHRLGVTVPRAVAVISFDGTEDAVFSDPPLTAIEQPVEEIAAAALNAVLDQHDEPVRTYVRVTLTARESCGCHPGGDMQPQPSLAVQSQVG